MADSIRARIAKRLAGSEWPEVQPEATTTIGVTEDYLSGMWRPFFQLSTKRLEVYADVEKMDDSVDEVETALDILADNAIAPIGGGVATFNIVWKNRDDSLAQAIDDMLKRARWHRKAWEIIRGTLLYGDEFRQLVWDGDGNIVRLMFMPAKSMVRNEDQVGLLKNGNTEGEWAFEQVEPDTQKHIAGFYPWEMLHMRWKKSGASAYGKSTLYTARVSWRKLVAMEEALVINWITRAFARLLFELDVTGKSKKEADAAIDEFLSGLTRRSIAKDVEGLEQLRVTTDIAIGRSYHEIGGRAAEGLTNVKVLDTSSTGFSNLAAIEYYQRKLVTSLRVPPAYLALERDINAKATLIQEDKRFARYLTRVQQVLSDGIAETIQWQLRMWDIDPTKAPFEVVWPKAGWSDVVEDAQALDSYSQADERYAQLGFSLDPDWIATHRYNMSAAEWQQRERANAPDSD